MLLLYPWWIAWAAYLCFGPARRRQADDTDVSSCSLENPPGLTLARRAAVVLLLTVTFLLGLAQVSIYARPHPWAMASQWIYERLPAGALVTVEAWDHPLPVPLGAADVTRFTQVTLPIFEEDGAEKAEALEAALTGADLIIIASRRGYGALGRYPDRYERTLAWYRALFASRDAVVFSRCPRLGPLAITDDPLRDAGFPHSLSLAQRCGTRFAFRLPRLDESTRVYDAPFVLVFPR
jgi:hypothetical protein